MLLRDIRCSVARVLTNRPDDWGTAFFVNPRGLALTCAHVAAKALSPDGCVILEVPGPPAGATEAARHVQLRARSQPSTACTRVDVAVLELLDELPSWLRPLNLAALDTIEGLSEVASHGFPLGRPAFGDPAKGVVHGTTYDNDGNLMIEIRSQELTGGFSGAPIVDVRTGHVAGMMKATLDPDRRGRFAEHAWAIPSAVIRTVAPEVQAEHHPVITELLRVARERMPTILDYALGTTEFTPLIEPSLLWEKKRPESTPISVADLRGAIASRAAELVLIVGEGGSGKSSLLRSWLTRSESSSSSDRLEIPIYIRATAFASVAGGDPADRVRRALLEDRVANVSASAAEFAALMKSALYQFVILIDGLDEIGDPLLRSETAANLRELATALKTHGHCVVVASRPILELDVLERTTLQMRRVRMAPVEASAREEFFIRFLGAEGKTLSAKFREYEGTRVGNLPMLLALSAVLFREYRIVPESVVTLFEGYVHLAAKRAARRAASGQALPEGPESLRFLPAIACHSLELTHLSRIAVRNVVQATLAASSPGWPAVALQVAADATVDAIAAEQIAAFQDGDQFRWVHQSLRDFFAGQHLADRATSGEDVRQSWPRWRDSAAREAVLFALVILSRRQGVEDVLNAALGLPADSAPDEPTIRFLIEGIKMGLRLPDETLREIIEATLFLGLDLRDEFNTCRRLLTFEPHPFDLLLKVRETIPQAGEVLLDLVDNENLPAHTRATLARKLGESRE